MHATATRHDRPSPNARSGDALSALLVRECERDGPGVLIPRPEVHVVVRFGAQLRGGMDVHAFGVREKVHRKLLRGGQRVITARLRLGTPDAALGVPASEMAGRIVALEDLWGEAATARLRARLSNTRGTYEAAATLNDALNERVATADRQEGRTRLALAAADKLRHGSVSAVADELGVSERQLRRVFRETVGMSPKAFARLSRFRHALRAAREDKRANWAGIAVTAGYYDQAHLIAEFRAITGVTPRRFAEELRSAPAVG